VVVLLAVVGFRLFPERDVTVLNDGQSFRVSATFDAQSEALEAAGVSLEPGDRVLYGTGGKFVSLAVQRARPVLLLVDGQLMEVRTQATTVRGVLADAGIELGSQDRVYVDGKLASARGPLFGVTDQRAVSAVPSRYRGMQVDPLRPITVSVQRAVPVTVYIDTFKLETASAATNVQDLLGELGMTVREGDLVQPGLDTPISAGMVVRLAKAITVNVRLDGKDQVLYTQARTVEDVLRILGVDPGPDEILSPPRETELTPGMQIIIGLNRTVLESVEEPVPPPTVYETDPSLPEGTVKVIPGTPGVRVTNYLVTYKNGEEVSRVLTEGGGIVTQPTPTRHITGAQPGSSGRPTLNAPGYSGTFTKKMTVRATWYNASHGAWAPGDPNYGRTATGVIVDYGICAVDPTVIPLGTRFYVPDYGVCLAADTGGGVKGYHVDLGFPESVGDPGWGSKIVDIYILD